LKQLSKRRSFSLQADGESMLPLLHPMDLVNYQKISFSKIKTNDLILIFKKNIAFTHRVIYKAKKYLVTKGDNNLESDGKIYLRNIVGKVTSVKRKNKIIDPEMIYLIQSSLYFKEIIKIVNAFNREKIDYVFLKGLPVHLYYEKTHPRRIYQDADIMIRRPDFEKIQRVMFKFGYKLADSSLSSFQKKLQDKTSEISFYKLINGFPVVFDIHQEAIFLMNQLGSLEALYLQKYIDQITDKFFREKIKVTLNGSSFFLLSPVNSIIFLAFHLFRHNFIGPYRFELLNKVIRKSHFRSALIDMLNKYRLNNFILPVFYLLNKYYKTHYNAVFLKKIKKYENINIFDDQDRLSMGINRFFVLFSLSPQPFYKKILIFTYPKVINAVVFSISQKFNNLLKNVFSSPTLNL
ncbi:MAG: nucleotidyltransferase family protein, partial [Patescibacteria group bacterium]